MCSDDVLPPRERLDLGGIIGQQAHPVDIEVGQHHRGRGVAAVVRLQSQRADLASSVSRARSWS